MSVYVIADLQWIDPAARAEYGNGANAALAPYEGRYVVAGGSPRTLEGDWEPTVVAVIEFPTEEHARRWYASEEYRPLKALRLASARGRAILVQGTT